MLIVQKNPVQVNIELQCINLGTILGKILVSCTKGAR